MSKPSLQNTDFDLEVHNGKTKLNELKHASYGAEISAYKLSFMFKIAI